MTQVEPKDVLEQEAIALARKEYTRETVAKFRKQKSKDDRVRNTFFRKEAIRRGFIVPADNENDQ